VSTRTSDLPPPEQREQALVELLLNEPEIVAWLGLDERHDPAERARGRGPSRSRFAPNADTIRPSQPS
jgi:hypothetical protein